ncbi:Isoamylase 1 chloroplastic [Bienertia sinuspersici]
MELTHYTPFSLSSPPKFFFNPQKLRCSFNLTCISSHFPSISIGFLQNSKTKQIMVNARDTSAEIDTVVIEKPSETLRFEISGGYPAPFGATARDGGVNFAIFSGNSVSATLCLITLSDLQENKITEQISLDPLVHKTGDVWHVLLKGNFDDMLYGYRFDGPFLPEGHYYDSSRIILDPYAKVSGFIILAVISRGNYGELGPEGNCWPQMAGMIPSPNDESQFDWQGDLPLKHPLRELVIYEIHVRGFTMHESSGTKSPGTYLGMIEKLDHLKELGVNCIELMPCQEFNELEYYNYNSAMGDYKYFSSSCSQYFLVFMDELLGYSTTSYFSPMIRYSYSGLRNCGREAINEFKLLVREAHKRGIEVIMDVVFNHTAEGNQKGPILSFRGIDNSVFYMLAPKGEFYNYSGCGNTFNCNHPVVRQFIVDCLRYWVTEMHVDGFRFDLASIMTRGSSPPLLDMISNDPVLCSVKLIAEAWDCGGLYQVGGFPHWGIWSEWNGKYRDMVRLFIKGTDGFAGAFAECLCGSPNLYKEGGRRPWHSINFLCAHDGFSLADLVTYNEKHNLANGENNMDGENHNNSWNCGQEGELATISVKKLRQRQMRNFILCLMVSQGVPMIYMGDEYGHTKGGNNNSYCHDNYINYFRWDKKEEVASDFFRFCCLMTKFRSECESLALNEFPTSERLQWHGHIPERPDWSETSRFVAFTLRDLVKGEIYVAFNTSHLPVTVTLPDRPGYRWEPLVDTSKPTPFDFLSTDVSERETALKQFQQFLDGNLYPMLSYSSVILLLKPNNIDQIS